MRESVSILTIVGILTSFLIGAAAEPLPPEAIPRMTKEQVKSMMGNPGFVIIDVRAPKDWDSSGSKINGANREDPSKAPTRADKYPKDKTLLFYCA